MSTDPLAAIQPDAGVTPSAADPVAPAVPDAPVIPAADDGKLSDEEKAEADEWDKAADDIFPGIHETKEEDKKPDEPAKPVETSKTPEAPKDGENGAKPPEPGAKKPDEAAMDKDSETEPAEPTDASARLTAREQQAEVDAVKSDIRERMFANQPTELKAGDGTLLDSPDKVMQFKNPATGEAFTREEATLWLNQAERELTKSVAETNQRVNEITDTNLNLKDQADVVNFQYGELLRAMPELRSKLWAEYEKTLEKDSKSGIITKAKVSLQSFYEAALEPYAELGRKLESDEANKTAATTQATEQAKKDAEAAKQQRRTDRSDIYGPGKVDTQTEDDKEWAAAAEAVFGKLK